MDVIEAIRKRRTVRFFQPGGVNKEQVLELLDLARVAPSAANRQPMEYVVVMDQEVRDALFDKLAFGAYVKPKRVPPPEKRPAAYIVALWDRDRSSFEQWEAGAALQNIMLGAVDAGLATCWLGGIDRDGIRSLLGVPDRFDIVAVLALGRPGEEPVLEEKDDDVKYWLDKEDVLHVPKRSLSSIVRFDRFTP